MRVRSLKDFFGTTCEPPEDTVNERSKAVGNLFPDTVVVGATKRGPRRAEEAAIRPDELKHFLLDENEPPAKRRCS